MKEDSTVVFIGFRNDLRKVLDFDERHRYSMVEPLVKVLIVTVVPEEISQTGH